ncbi:MAG: aromatic acid decarboxylase [Actinobacteria bacterium HGW-Actinobacteria-10]|jgi:4-hydroxy-3-polyprenylbenzoate decarboxylase|nr:MAG: aromatic acid decarboxylase [Actinobacteria bacterium HGW-Actinobacteria-10]
MARYTVVITGASGSVYGLRLIEKILASGHEVTMSFTQAGVEVCGYETGFDLPAEQPARSLLRFLELPLESPLRNACCNDSFDPIASGSHLTDGMIVCPASMGFVAKVANGIADNLPARAAAVCLKERRPLVLVPRETPLSLINLRNMTAAAEAGAVVLPAMPAFYQRPESLDDAVNFVAGKVLDVLGVEHSLFERWGD